VEEVRDGFARLVDGRLGGLSDVGDVVGGEEAIEEADRRRRVAIDEVCEHMRPIRVCKTKGRRRDAPCPLPAPSNSSAPSLNGD
jgi:hypothetical protein